MKVSPVTLLLTGLALGGLAFGSCQAGRASDAEIRYAALRHDDSLSQAQYDRDLTNWRRDHTRLADSAALLSVRLRALQRFVPAAKDSIRRLLAQLPDSQRAPLETAVAVIGNFGDSCQASLAVATQQVSACDQRAAADSLRLAQVQGVLAQTEAVWRSEQQHNRPGFLGLRSYWRARTYTLPLTVLAILALTK